tara:strand:+ start:359 stop:814 length:456 start_codon:yes stop_codon:yes gene_type:complete
MTMNKILVIGNLGSDPEMRYTPNGNAVTSFSVATNRRYKTSDGETREETEWFRVNAWNRLGETCNQYLQRGSKVYVEGTLTSGAYLSNDGDPRASLDIRATEVRFLDSRNSGPTNSTNETYSSQSQSQSQESGQASQVSGQGGEEFDDLPW